MLRVTVVDESTGRSSTAHVREGDYLVIAAAPCIATPLESGDGGRTVRIVVTGRVPQRGDGLWRPEN